MVLTDADLLLRINNNDGGSEGQLLLENVTFSGSRDNSMIYGIGNKRAQDVDPGNEEFTISVDMYMNQRAAAMLRRIVEGEATGPTAGYGGSSGSDLDVAYLLLDGAIEATIRDFRWNSFDIDVSEDGEVSVSLEADCLGVSLNEPDGDNKSTALNTIDDDGSDG